MNGSQSFLDTVTIGLTPSGGSVVPWHPVTGSYDPHWPYDPHDGGLTYWYMVTNATNDSRSEAIDAYVPHQLMVNITDSEGNWDTITVDLTVMENSDGQVAINDAVRHYTVYC